MTYRSRNTFLPPAYTHTFLPPHFPPPIFLNEDLGGFCGRRGCDYAYICSMTSSLGKCVLNTTVRALQGLKRRIVCESMKRVNVRVCIKKKIGSVVCYVIRRPPEQYFLRICIYMRIVSNAGGPFCMY